MRSKISALCSALTLIGSVAAMSPAAAVIPYPASGTYNAQTYTFTASTTGDLIGYFAGQTANYRNQIGVLVNGVLSSAGYGLDNKSSTVGQSFNFGSVTAGDTLVFVLRNITVGTFAYSDPSMNAAYDGASYTGGHNHIYSAAYDGTNPAFGGIPAGTYIGFEDKSFPTGDYDYDDETFVFTSTTASPSGVPEPASWAMFIGGFGLIGAAMRRKTTVRFA